MLTLTADGGMPDTDATDLPEASVGERTSQKANCAAAQLLHGLVPAAHVLGKVLVNPSLQPSHSPPPISVEPVPLAVMVRIPWAHLCGCVIVGQSPNPPEPQSPHL